MGTNVSFGWRPDLLELEGTSRIDDTAIEVADSWLVDNGRARALALHKARFAAAIPSQVRAELRFDAFWLAALALIPRTGRIFPRIELTTPGGTRRLSLRLRPAPPVSTSVTAITHVGPDPRMRPTVKGPDLAAMAAVRKEAQRSGAEEAVFTTADGFVVEGATTGLLWWRGATLCAPLPEFERVDSITARSAIMLATALGTPIRYEAVRPQDLDGLEVWAVNALHGIRIITAWVDGPRPAARPHRLATWRSRLGALTQPLMPSSP
jgi:branched-subunit amino acid aminotransferase/4-amino-4-deoxychorismate lyase